MKVTFGASYIKPIGIIKKEGEKATPENVALVELDLKDKNDSKALDDTIAIWGRDTYLDCARDGIRALEKKGAKTHLYAVTSQSHGFNKLDENKVLGAAVFVEGQDANKLDLLQVKPENMASSKIKNGYARVGYSLVDSLKTIYPNKPIKVYSDVDAVGFYEKCGFEKVIGNNYIWTNKKKSR